MILYYYEYTRHYSCAHLKYINMRYKLELRRTHKRKHPIADPFSTTTGVPRSIFNIFLL